MKYRMVMTQLKEHSPNSINKLYIIGGGAKNKLLCQLTANALNMQVVTGPAEATAAGNILMQARAMGHISSLGELREVVRNSFESEVYMPEDIDVWERHEKRLTRLIDKYTNQ
jgi:sugar (pentulose or hexulose) kinase